MTEGLGSSPPPSCSLHNECGAGKRVVNTCIEGEVLGSWTIRLRNLGGIVAAITTCVVAILNGVTTHMSVTAGHEWPSDLTMLIVNIGPIIIGWSYMQTNKTISAILGSETSATRIRRKMADVIAPKDD